MFKKKEIPEPLKYLGENALAVIVNLKFEERLH